MDRRSASHSDRLCSNESCRSGQDLIEVSNGTRAGGHDWRHLEGCVLCKDCFDEYATQGKFQGQDEPAEQPEQGGDKRERRCSYEKCKSPHKSSHFYAIQAGWSAGNRDWSRFVGHVLCSACYSCFRQKGTLERTDSKRPSGLAREERKCSFEKCGHEGSGQFIQVSTACKSGGQDWSALVGKVLCEACYGKFRKSGTLERKLRRHGAGRGVGGGTGEGEDETEPAVKNESDDSGLGGASGSTSTSHSSSHVAAGKQEGVGKQLRGAKSRRTPHSSSGDGESPPPRWGQAHQAVEAAGGSGGGAGAQEVASGSCVLCTAAQPSCCLIPCAHEVLCTSCADLDAFYDDARRPFSVCPVCGEKLEVPYIIFQQ